MPDAIPTGAITGKRLETPSAAEYAEMLVNRMCIVESMQAFKLYFDRWRAGEAKGDEEIAGRVKYRSKTATHPGAQ